ncbi:MAG: hypothetical protein ACPHDT_15740, partial [Acidimicrobiales bacterium]
WEDANCEGADDDIDDEDAFGDDPFSSPEALEAMLSSEAGRALMIEGMIEDGEFSAEQAACLLDNLDLETLVVLLNDMDEEPPPEVVVSLLLLLDTCDLGDLFAE